MYGLTWDQADRALVEFQLNHARHFPFVPLEPDIGARQLSVEKPFLFRVVMHVAARVMPERKKAMKRSVLAYLGHHLLVNGE